MPAAPVPRAPSDADLVARARWVLLGSAAVTLGLYLIPYGAYVAYPLLLISTVVHELGHGIAAVLMGAEFDRFLMWKDGSGVAYHTTVDSAFGAAFISAGGLCGPAVAAAVCFGAGRKPVWSKRVLAAFGIGLALAMLLVVRNAFGLFFVGALAASCLGIALWARAEVSQLAIVFLGVQLALSVYSRGDYLFMQYAQTSMGKMPSDTQQMADALGLPYWFWGGACAAFSAAVLIGGGYSFLRGAGRPGAGGATRRSPASAARPASPRTSTGR